MDNSSQGFGTIFGRLSGRSVEKALDAYGEVYGEVLLGIHREVQKQGTEIQAQQREASRLDEEIRSQQRRLQQLQEAVEVVRYPMREAPRAVQSPTSRQLDANTDIRRLIRASLGISLLAFAVSVTLAVWILV